MQTTSIFEIIGPEMIGPSSSHTAGMVRIGMMARRIAGPPRKVELYMHQMFQYLYKGHKTDAALVGGAIGMDQKDERLRSALSVAAQMGVVIGPMRFYPDTTLHPNTVGMTIWNERSCHVRGISIGGGSVVIDQIDGAAVTVLADRYAIIVWSDADLSGRLAARDGVSVTGGKADRGYVYALCSALPFPASLQEELAALPEVRHIQPVEPLLEFGCAPDLTDIPDSIAALTARAAQEKLPLWKLSLGYEQARSGQSADEILARMAQYWHRMKTCVEAATAQPQQPLYGLVDGKDAQRLRVYAKEKPSVCSAAMLDAVQKALAVMEYNASMGCIVAAPTAGSSGIVPACLTALQERFSLSDEDLVHALLVAGIFGVVMAHRGASFSGAVGGCQAEVGVSGAIAAAAIASVLTADPQPPAHAMAICMKNILGLVCDPIAGPIEVPCVKRNAIGVANALVSADLALAGITSYVPPDELIDAFLDVERRMPKEVKAGGAGALASSPCAKALRRSLEDGSFLRSIAPSPIAPAEKIV